MYGGKDNHMFEKLSWWYFRKVHNQLKRKIRRNQEMSNDEKQELIDEKIRFDSNYNF